MGHITKSMANVPQSRLPSHPTEVRPRVPITTAVVVVGKNRFQRWASHFSLFHPAFIYLINVFANEVDVPGCVSLLLSNKMHASNYHK